MYSLVGDDLGADEAVLEVGVDHAGRLRRGAAAAHRPGAHFLQAGGEVGLQAQQLVAGADHAVQAGLVEPEIREELGSLGLLELGDLRLDRRAHRHHLRALGRGALLAGRSS